MAKAGQNTVNVGGTGRKTGGKTGGECSPEVPVWAVYNYGHLMTVGLTRRAAIGDIVDRETWARYRRSGAVRCVKMRLVPYPGLGER